THRGPNSLFNQIIRGIRENGNPMKFRLYSYPIEKAIEEGIVERINERSGRNETREQFYERIHAECIDEDHWNQEYRCIPADEFYRLLELPQLRRCCIEKNGIGMQLGEEAHIQYGHKVEVLHVTSSLREKLAFGLRNAFESRALKIPMDAKLRADLHGIKKTA